MAAVSGGDSRRAAVNLSNTAPSIGPEPSGRSNACRTVDRETVSGRPDPGEPAEAFPGSAPRSPGRIGGSPSRRHAAAFVITTASSGSTTITPSCMAPNTPSRIALSAAARTRRAASSAPRRAVSSRW